MRKTGRWFEDSFRSLRVKSHAEKNLNAKTHTERLEMFERVEKEEDVL